MSRLGPTWAKSSYSESSANCVETRVVPLAADVDWRASSQCSAGQCVEVATGDRVVQVRDSKDPQGPRLTFCSDAWRAFLVDVRADQFGLADGTGGNTA